MAAPKQNVAAQAAQIIQEVKQGSFSPLYLLMGDEPYWPSLVCDAIIENCIDESFKDFNETICYGLDTNADYVGSVAREFPMMAERRLVVIREAQLMKTLEDLAPYCADPSDTTVLVIHIGKTSDKKKASIDKRKALYKSIKEKGVVLESNALRDYEVPGWIQNYYSSRGLSIAPDAAQLLAESTGTELSRIVMETDKLLKNLPEGATAVTAADIEKNVGISRQFSVFELTRALSEKNVARSFKIARNMGSAAGFAMPMVVSALYLHFNRILRYAALCARGNYSPEEKEKALAGVNAYFYREYDMAVRNYPLRSAMNIMSLLCEYDYLGKGGDGAAAPPEELFVELIAKILNS